MMWRRVLSVLATMAISAPALAGTLAGVTLPDTVTVNGTQLKLNGMGLRKKLFIKVYLGALYVTAPSKDETAIVAADAPKRMVMHFLYKEVEKAKLDEAWRDGFTANSGARLAALQTRLEQFSSWWPAMKAGERAVITYVPGTGTSLEINGKAMGTIEGKDFADAMFAVWLGAVPADEGLKAGLLGE